MINKVKAGMITGIEGSIIDVEIDISKGMPCFSIVGLAGAEVRESKERVRSAIINSGYDFPLKRLIVNLSPADLKKDGSYLDLAILMGIMREKLKVDDSYLEESVFLGELSLDAKIKSMRGIIAIVLSMLDKNIRRIFIPYDNFMECSSIDGIEIIPVKSVNETIKIINMREKERKKHIEDIIDGIVEGLGHSRSSNGVALDGLGIGKSEFDCDSGLFVDDFFNIRGNELVKRCAVICLAGGHNMLMVGPPGTGKTMMARAMKNVLPRPNDKESLEISRIYSAAGKLKTNGGLMKTRPFRQPHHTTTKISMIGGGVNSSLGEISLANKGVLFLDELAEFPRPLIESLRQPIEDGVINISRLNRTVTYPADFILLASLNPCPCGYLNSSKPCTCSQSEIDRYKSRISGPILDRIDLYCEVVEADYDDILGLDKKIKKSVDYLEDINMARAIQMIRFEKKSIDTNSHMSTEHINDYCRMTPDAQNMMRIIHDKYGLSNRVYMKMLKIARTIADLELVKEIKINRLGEENKNWEVLSKTPNEYMDLVGNNKIDKPIEENHILEAFSYRKAYFKYFSPYQLR